MEYTVLRPGKYHEELVLNSVPYPGQQVGQLGVDGLPGPGDEALPSVLQLPPRQPLSFQAAYHFFPNCIGQTSYAFVLSASHRDSTYANGITASTTLISLVGLKAGFGTIRTFAIAAFY
ncbi:hypothetical protein [Paraburkholderia ribeironis]|uniref:hypothetical protein n=1 Tax=Paraburkholderia ribeironis TaxID=1247936 RepID=UPI0011775419|nr:hypothetical protein [Paraburkholderia ribeironis]